MSESSAKPHFVFVHGASHGAWCWFKIRTLLESLSYKVTCLDLKGAGLNLTDPNTVLAFDDYNQPLFDFLSNLPPDEKVILIGHSAAGATVTDALCKFTDKICLVVYIAADMVKPGFTYQDIKNMEKGDKKLSLPMGIFDYIYGQGDDQPPTGIIMKKEFQREYYYTRCPQEDSTLASMLLRPAPTRGLRGSAPPETPEADKVPRVYMKTMHDHMLSTSMQDAMIEKWPPEKVYALESDHCPFLSTPTVLFGFLVEAAGSLI